MCHHVIPLQLADLEQALANQKATGRARISGAGHAPDAYPGKQLPLFVVGDAGELTTCELTWGFEAPEHVPQKLVFNTRLDTALRHARSGRGMWAQALERGRCLLPVRAFFESWTRQPPSKGAEVRFDMNGHGVFLLAAVQEAGRFSIVTVDPGQTVGRYHTRMPLVLGPGESNVWLGPSFADLSNRSDIPLVATPAEGASAQQTLAI